MFSLLCSGKAMSVKGKECDLIYLSEILNTSFSSHKITTISHSLNILSISVLHIFLLLLLTLKRFSITSLPNALKHLPVLFVSSSAMFSNCFFPNAPYISCFPAGFPAHIFVFCRGAPNSQPSSSLLCPSHLIPVPIPALGQGVQASSFR